MSEQNLSGSLVFGNRVIEDHEGVTARQVFPESPRDGDAYTSQDGAWRFRDDKWIRISRESRASIEGILSECFRRGISISFYEMEDDPSSKAKGPYRIRLKKEHGKGEKHLTVSDKQWAVALADLKLIGADDFDYLESTLEVGVPESIEVAA